MTILTADWLTAPGARDVAQMIAAGGHQALYVGGCVRNALIGGGATDIDMATDARPERVMELAAAAGLRAVPTGIEHGTVTVVVDGRGYEVTTFRRDVETDGRHAVVAFSGDVAEDAARRDFTMNALYARPDGTVLDPLGSGVDDLAARHLRFIGDPQARITEDYLRILRFFRFHAWYGDPDGGIDAEGLAACAELADGIEGLSRERIGTEMLKLLAAPDPAPSVAAMTRAGVMLRVLPGAGAHTLTVLVHVEEAAGLAPDAIRRLASLGGEDEAPALRLSRSDAARLDRLKAAVISDMGAQEIGWRLGAAEGLDVMALRAAGFGRELTAAEIASVADGAAKVFPVKAADLMPDHSGPALGAALRTLESAWIAGGFTASRDELLHGLQKQA